MTAPLLYHDPEHELALVLMPHQLNLHHNEQQKIIGDFTNSLLNKLSPEQRKAYLLTPKIFFNLESMVNAVLEAEGITPEVMERQKAKANLINQLLQAQSEEELRQVAKEHEGELDYEFFQMLTASAQSAHADGQPQLAQALLGLRAWLSTLSGAARAAVAEVDASLGLGESINREELLTRMQSTQSDQEFEALVAAARPLLDYAFFQNLTAQIDAAPDADTADRLRALRKRILDTSAKLDDEVRSSVQRAGNLLKAILEAEDPQALARQRLEEIDDTFFVVLSANVQRAEAENRKDMAEALQRIADMVLGLIEDTLPPEVRFVSQLLNAPFPDGTQQLLESQRQTITPQFITALDQVITQLEEAGNAEAAEHMRQVKGQAEMMSQGILHP
jgi:hypothetical protein